RFLAARYDDGTQRVWDAERRQVALEVANTTMLPAFSPDGRQVAFGAKEGSIVLYDLAARKDERRIPAPTSHPLAFDSAGRRLAEWSDQDRNVRICDAGTGEVLATLPHPRRVITLAWQPTGELLVTACDDFYVYGWEMPSGRRLWSVKNSNTPSM